MLSLDPRIDCFLSNIKEGANFYILTIYFQSTICQYHCSLFHHNEWSLGSNFPLGLHFQVPLWLGGGMDIFLPFGSEGT